MILIIIVSTNSITKSALEVEKVKDLQYMCTMNILEKIICKSVFLLGHFWFVFHLYLFSILGIIRTDWFKQLTKQQAPYWWNVLSCAA